MGRREGGRARRRRLCGGYFARAASRAGSPRAIAVLVISAQTAKVSRSLSVLEKPRQLGISVASRAIVGLPCSRSIHRAF